MTAQDLTELKIKASTLNISKPADGTRYCEVKLDPEHPTYIRFHSTKNLFQLRKVLIKYIFIDGNVSNEGTDHLQKLQTCYFMHPSPFKLSTSSTVHQLSCTNPPVSRTVLGHLVH